MNLNIVTFLKRLFGSLLLLMLCLACAEESSSGNKGSDLFRRDTDDTAEDEEGDGSSTTDSLTLWSEENSFTLKYVTAGKDHQCGLSHRGALYCWGKNGAAQLGDSEISTDYESTAQAVAFTIAEDPVYFESLAAGDDFNCAKTHAGKIYCWGDNQVGQLGSGSANPNEADLQAMELADDTILFREVYTGITHACAVTFTGTAHCWGGNDAGEIGNNDGVTASFSTPEDVDTTNLDTGNGEKFKSLYLGTDHTCGLTNLGNIFCWGDNQSGQLGDDNSGIDSFIPVAVSDNNLAEGEVFTELASNSLGGNFTCALSSLGKTYCWGDNTKGQCGTGGGTTDLPTEVDDGNFNTNEHLIEVTASQMGACGISSSHAIYCWGDNTNNSLGFDSVLSTVSSPDAIDVSNASSTRFLQISMGNDHTCALDENFGLHCWGTINGSVVTTPTFMTLAESINEINTFHTFSLGKTHSCAIDSHNDVYCWGDNSFGQLGHGSTESTHLPYKAVSIDDAVKSVAAGDNHTCASTYSGLVYCWGSNLYKQIGSESVASLNAPFRITLAPDFPAINVSAGTNHTCIGNVSNTGACLGRNTFGQLGDDSTTQTFLSSPVSTVLSLLDIQGGANHSCALSGAGDILCWGSDDSSQIGDAANGDQLTPTQAEFDNLATGEKALKLAVGSFHNCFTTDNGKAWCFGLDEAGQIGDAVDDNEKSLAVEVDSSGLTGDYFKSIAAGGNTTCALDDQGIPYCWGEGTLGELGNGLNSDRSQPSNVAIGSVTVPSFNTIAVGGSHACAQTVDGKVYCWGSNTKGQIGFSTSLESSNEMISL